MMLGVVGAVVRSGLVTTRRLGATLSHSSYIIRSTSSLRNHASGFGDLGVNIDVVAGLAKLKIETPTDVQAKSIPQILKGDHTVVNSQTGTGKTFAFLLPVLQKVAELGTDQDGVAALILAPTGELAQQLWTQVCRLSQAAPSLANVRCCTAVSAKPIEKQLRDLESIKPNVLIATPGRLADLSQNHNLSLENVRWFIVDECERLLADGLLAETQMVWGFLPRPKQAPVQVILATATVDATTLDRLKRMAPRHTMIELNATLAVPPNIKLIAYTIAAHQKIALLVYLLRRRTPLRQSSCIVFVRLRHRALSVAAALSESGFAARAMHKETTFQQRREIMDAFQNKKLQIIVATDVLSRGIDLVGAYAVFNLDLPFRPNDFVHRAGRVGRDGSEGVCISLVTPNPKVSRIGNQPVAVREMEYLEHIRETIGAKIELRKIPGPWEHTEIAEPELPIDKNVAEKQMRQQLTNVTQRTHAYRKQKIDAAKPASLRLNNNNRPRAAPLRTKPPKTLGLREYDEVVQQIEAKQATKKKARGFEKRPPRTDRPAPKPKSK